MKKIFSQIFSVRAYGALGDGGANDTAAVQAAIDACRAAGGGRVHFDAGVYCCGTLDLRNNVELFLDAGAVLRGSPRRADYDTAGNAPYDVEFPGRRTSVAHLIRAVRADNIAIRGRGVIDGNGGAFFGAPRENHPLRRFDVPGWRPGHMLALCECRDVLIEGVQLINSPTYTVWPFACERLRVHGVTIRNPPETPNGDGIDPTACRDVIISDCFIDTADDCIALYSGPANGAFGAVARACENIVITNCILRSGCVGVRLGPHGDGAIRDCVMSNLVVDARVGIGMHVYSGAGGKAAGTILENLHGPLITDIQVRNLDIHARQAPIFIQIHPDSAGAAGIQGVAFSGLRLRGPGAVCVDGCAGRPVTALELSDIAMHLAPPAGELLACVPYPLAKLGAHIGVRIPGAIYLRHARDVTLRNIRIWKADARDTRPAMVAEESADVTGSGDCRMLGEEGVVVR